MAAPYNDVLSKLEAALASIVTALALTGTRGSTAVAVTVLTGEDDDTIAMPKIVCEASETSEEVVYNSGLLRVPARVHIFSHSEDETLAVHRARVGTVADAMADDDAPATLSAAVADFHCYAVQWLGLAASPEGNAFHTSIDLNVVCCGSAIS